MSGPISVVMTSDPMLGLLSAAAIRTAVSIAQAQQQARVLAEEHQQQRLDNQETQTQAIEQGQQALLQQLNTEQNEFHRLKTIAEQLGYSEQLNLLLQHQIEVKPDEQYDGVQIKIIRIKGRCRFLNSSMRSCDRFYSMNRHAV